MYNTKSFILCTAAVYWLISSNAVVVKSNILNLTKNLNGLHQSIFYNNSKIIVDKEGRVEKFMKKYQLDFLNQNIN